MGDRYETYLRKIAGEDVDISNMPEPSNRYEYYLRQIALNGGGSVDPEDIAEVVTDWLAEHVDPDTGYVIDDTFTVENAAPESKKTGEELNSLKSAVSNNLDLSSSNLLEGYVAKNGAVQTSGAFVHSKPFIMYKGDKLTLTARGYLTNVSMISKYTEGVYTPLVISTASEVLTYTYTATKQGEYVVSFNSNYAYSGYIQSNIAKALSGFEIGGRETFGWMGILPRLAVIGDSLASGCLNIEGVAENVYGDSWLSYLARKTNATARTHYAEGGLTAQTWLASTNYTKMLSDNPFSAYFIALGTNDRYLEPYDLGTISDEAGTNSFVGYYKQIIEAVRTKAPNSAIFCVSLYGNQEGHHTYSQMISDIADLYTGCFYVDYINNTDIFTSTGGVWAETAHFTTLGYNYVASVIYELVNNIIKDNKAFFKFFGKNNSVGTQYED